MIKKVVACLMAGLLTLFLNACDIGGSVSTASKESQQSSADLPGTVESDSRPEKSSAPEVSVPTGGVVITLPGHFFESDPDFDPVSYAQKQGFTGVEVNEDGSVTITMTEERQREILTELKEEMEDISEELTGGSATPYVTNIICNDNFTQIVIEVERESYEAAVDMVPVTLGFSAILYQEYSGQELHCEIIIKDAATGETITNVVYPDVLER